jgi:hypothetical protein
MRKKTCKELDSAIATITRALMSEESGLVQDRALRAALRELRAVAKGGRQIPRKRLVRIVGSIAEFACRKFLKKDDDAQN